MTRFFTTFSLFILISSSLSAQVAIYDSVFLQAGYSKDVYYSLAAGELKSASGTDWDMAISVQHAQPPTNTLLSTTIRLNGGRGVEVYKITKRDTTGFLAYNYTDTAGWIRLLDSESSWDDGALNSTRSGSDPFDYGWGKYIFSTHNVLSDSVYALKTTTGALKKLWIKELVFDTLWQITISDFDNSNINNITISKDHYPGKKFVYLDADNGTVSDLEPTEPWDILFTHCISEVAPAFYYPVTGALISKGTEAIKTPPVDITTVDYSNYAGSFTSNISEIGFDWKEFNGTSYDIKDSIVYFVRTTNSDVYSVRFTGFDNTDGKIVFEKKLVSGQVGIDNVNIDTYLTVYPNPTDNNIRITGVNVTAARASVQLVDITGRMVRHSDVINAGDMINVNWSVNEITPGIYFIKLINGKLEAVKKVVVN